jgi:hypothetical protein
MILAAAICLSLGLPANRAYADADAILRQMEGPVQVRPNGDKIYVKAEPGFPLTFNDQVKTGPKGIAQIEFPNGSVILVKEKSLLLIGGDVKKTWVSFSIGEFLIGIKRTLGADESFLVRTPSAVASVRGTLFWGMSDAKNNSIWSGFGHTILITAQKKTVTVGPGQTVKVPYGSGPENVETSTIPKSYLNTFAVEGDILGLDALADPSIR